MKGNGMKKLSEFIIKFRIPIIIFFVILCIASGVMYFFITVNSDITSYLPTDSNSSIGQQFLKENFGIEGDMMIVVKEEKGMRALRSKAMELEGIENMESVTWIGATSMQLMQLISPEGYQKAYDALVQGENEDQFLFVCTLTVNSSDPKAFDVIEKAKAIFSDNEATFSGTVALSKQTFDETIYSLPVFTAIALVMILIVLLLTTQSWLEPFILFLSIIAAILINMGSNLIFPDISIITHSCASILQIGLTMDYAIFLMHSYRSEMLRSFDPHAALVKAVPHTLKTVAASALTTIGGFVALCFMRISVGTDLAKVLIKGIVLSLLTIMILQPALIMTFRKWLEKGKHRYLNFQMRKPVAFSIKHKWPIVICVFALIAVCAWGQTTISYNYLKFSKPIENPTENQQIAEKMGNQIIIVVPNEPDKQKEMLERLHENEAIVNIMGIYEFLPVEIVTNPSYAEMFKQFINNGYTMYTVSIAYNYESSEGIAALNYVRGVLGERFDEFHITGTSQAVQDLAAITPTDLAVVTGVSIGIIALILLLSLRSFKKTLLIVLLIQGGIWINISLSALISGEMNFMTVIAINAIQLGATIDYAILMTTKFKEYRKEGMPPKTAAIRAGKNSAMSIITSALIMICVCLSVLVISQNLIVTEITGMIARGSFISALLVIVVMPSLLVISEYRLFKRKKKLTDSEIEDVTGEAEIVLESLSETREENSETRESPVAQDGKT